MNWIAAKGRVIVKMTRIFSSNVTNLCHTIGIGETEPNGICRIHKYIQPTLDPYQMQTNVLQLFTTFILTLHTTLQLTVEACSSIQIMFYPEETDDNYYGYNKVHEDMKFNCKEHNEQKKKDFLFLMAS